MKSSGLLHAQLSAALARLGVEESLVLGHCGVAAAPGQEFVDLAVAHGLPSLLDVFDAVLPEFLCAEVALPEWCEERHPDTWVALMARAGHRRLRPMQTALLLNAAERARVVVRTGEATPMLLVLRSGHPWNELEESVRTGAPRPERASMD